MSQLSLIGRSIQDLQETIQDLPAIRHSTKLNVYLNASEKLLEHGERCHRTNQIEKEYIYKMKFVVFIMKLIKSHKGFTDEMKISYKERCSSVMTQLESVKVKLKQLYAERRKLEELENKEQNSLEKSSHSESVEIGEFGVVETIEKQNATKQSIPESGNVPTKLELKETDMPMEEVWRYFSKSASKPLYRLVDIDLTSLSKPPYEKSELSFPKSIEGKQFDPSYTLPEHLITLGATCSKNFKKNGFDNHNKLNKNLNLISKPTYITPPPHKEHRVSSFPLLTNQKPSTTHSDSTFSLSGIEFDGEVLESFMKCAVVNNRNKIESCAILSGILDEYRNVYVMTHLIIPKQSGTSDTCNTLDEEDILEYQLKHNLCTLGWIHTHPTQACFLSSVDLHTQFSYQALLKEAIAVVIAPRDNPNFSIFRLSDYGMKTIQSCKFQEFHHHDERNLYETCRHIHIRWKEKKYKVVDLR